MIPYILEPESFSKIFNLFQEGSIYTPLRKDLHRSAGFRRYRRGVGDGVIPLGVTGSPSP
jgi:hypothetical protein